MHVKVLLSSLLCLISVAVMNLSGARPSSEPETIGKLGIFINHLGYEQNGSKRAVIEAPADSELQADILSHPDGRRVMRVEVKKAGPVDSWKSWFFWTVDFSSLNQAGQYILAVKGARNSGHSFPFVVSQGLLVEETLSDVLFHFKSQRASGDYDRTDRAVPFFGGREGRVDAHGGWYDASGDTSKYLSHLAYTNTMCPQQSPLMVWGLLDALAMLKKSPKGVYPEVEKRMIDEAVYGADFLVRMQDPAGYFYMNVFDKWSKLLQERMICAYKTQNGDRTDAYQAAFREGGGMTVAALARAAALGQRGDYGPADYLKAARSGFAHLQAHNRAYCDDGKENIIDDYCALMAAAELYAATRESEYLRAAEARASALCSRLSRDRHGTDWWRSDDLGELPFFHGADAGLPVVALVRFLETARETTLKDQVLETVKRSLIHELAVTGEVNNPFGYARQIIQPSGEESRTSFFIPHKNPSGYWWQGENARLASLAAAARKVKPLLGQKDGDLAQKLMAYAQDQLNWILGLNPFDTCMLKGTGRNNPAYDPGYYNSPGGISNGITAGYENEADIDFIPEKLKDNPEHTWRWGEQWLSHAVWYMLAVCAEA